MTYRAPAGGFRTFLIVWVSQSLSVFGSALSGFALNIWLVQTVYPLPEQRPQLAWTLAATGLLGAITSMITMPVAGALVDRFDRRRLMIAADIMNGLVMAVAAFLMAYGHLEIWMLLVFCVVLTMLQVLHGSAFDTAYAMLVPDEQLPRANGMMQTMWSLSSLLSPAAAATIIALPALARQGSLPITFLANVKEGAALAFGIDAITFCLAAVVLTTQRIPSPKRSEASKKASIWVDVRFGVDYIWKRRPLLWLLATFAVVNLCLPIGIFLPLIVKTDLIADWTARGFTYETAVAVINTTMAAGGLVGGVAVSIWGGLKRKRVIGLMAAMIIGGVAQVGLGISSGLYLAAAGAFFISFSGPMANAHSQAIWQSQVPREVQGRVFAVRRVMGQALGPLSTVMAGWMAGAFDPGHGLAILGG
ncbi:MAG TPA: MFS transporter, partial [Symbiobacteriaceae bacterium]|nr:MFS transporter [Symbiobacteriaceae bacterium]